MTLAVAVAHTCVENCHAAAKAAGFSVGFVPHAAMIVSIAVVLGLWSLLPWWQLRKCTCEHERGTFLKPRWRRYDKKGK